jgi:outer membrane usher protein
MMVSNRKKKKALKINAASVPDYVWLPLILLFAAPAARAELYFDPSMIEHDGSTTVADLSRFEHEGNQLPGAYQTDIYLNDVYVSSRTLSFKAQEGEKDPSIHDNTGLKACLTKKVLAQLGVKISAFPKLIRQADDACISPGEFIPQAWTKFNFQKMRFDISIPQAALENRPAGWIPPEQWDEGINAALLSYRFNGSSNQGRYSNSSNNYLQLNSGLNLGAWRLRDERTWENYQSDYYNRNQWQHLNTWIERAIIPWRSELTLGDGTAAGDVFDSVSFRGAQLATDDNMYPDSQRGFAPDIRGVAASNARVSIRQNGNLVYQTFVSPGPFVINDLYPLSGGGDLNVTVTEADGSIKTFTVPFSSVPVLQRNGFVRYAIVAGRYRGSSDSYDDPAFTQATLQWGLPQNITVYGGTQLADNYQAGTLGTGLNMGDWGAISGDVTQAYSRLADDSRHEGQSLRFLYARSLITTGTSFQLAGYRYSTQGFHTLQDTALNRMTGLLYQPDTVGPDGRPLPLLDDSYYNLYDRKRSTLQLSISQRLGDLGFLYLNGTRQTYWGESGTSTSQQVGFSSTLGRVSYSISGSYTRTMGFDKANRSLFLSLSMPLGSTGSHHDVWANYSAAQDRDGHVAQQAGLSGTALADNNLNWSVSQGYDGQSGNTGDASLNWLGGYGTASAGYSYGPDSRQVNYGLAGGMILHRNGLTLGQPLGQTSILVAAPGATDLPVSNGTGISTDWRGYAVVPYASQYRENRVALDVEQLNDDVDIDDAVTRVVPTRGAVVRAGFKTRVGVRALLTLSHHGKPLPFGATVSQGDSGSIVGDDGQVYLSGLTSGGILQAKWGDGADEQCTVSYRLPNVPPETVVIRGQYTCLDTPPA